MKKIIAALLLLALLTTATACSSANATPAPAAAPAPAENAAKTAAEPAAPADAPKYDNVTVKLGIMGASDETVWDPIVAEFAEKGVKIEYVFFTDYTQPNAALDAGDIDLNSFQHYTYLNNEKDKFGYKIDGHEQIKVKEGDTLQGAAFFEGRTADTAYLAGKNDLFQ